MDSPLKMFENWNDLKSVNIRVICERKKMLTDDTD
jgi:hypothetical protein